MDIEKFFEVLGILFAENNNIEIKSVKVDKIQKEA
jgi:hypothetical protein